MTFWPQLRRLLSALVLTCAVFWPPAEAVAQFRFSTVVIDPGHGGKDPGALRGQRVEKHLALDVAKRLETALRAKGLKTFMTRRTDVFVDLDQRAALANRFSSAVFVSIHFNTDPQKVKKGAEMHYHSDKGLVLARALDRTFDQSVQMGCRALVERSRLVVLRETNMPAVMVECGYLTHAGNAWLCGTADHRQDIANAIVAGLLAVRKK